MNDPIVKAAEQAAIPVAINALQAFQQFDADMGPDPTKWLLNYPGAKLKFLGTLGLQLPTLLTSEGAVLQSAANTEAASWITVLKAAQAKS